MCDILCSNKYLKNKVMACSWVGFDLLIFRRGLPWKYVHVYCNMCTVAHLARRCEPAG